MICSPQHVVQQHTNKTGFANTPEQSQLASLPPYCYQTKPARGTHPSIDRSFQEQTTSMVYCYRLRWSLCIPSRFYGCAAFFSPNNRWAYGMKWHTGAPPGLVRRTSKAGCSGFQPAMSRWQMAAKATSAGGTPRLRPQSVTTNACLTTAPSCGTGRRSIVAGQVAVKLGARFILEALQ